MAGKSPLTVTQEQRSDLKRLSVRQTGRKPTGRGRSCCRLPAGPAPRSARRSARVREDTVRDWRSAFMREGLAGIARHAAPGRPR